MTTKSIVIPDDMANDVTRLAKEFDQSEEDFYREAISQYLELVQRPLPSLVGMASDGSLSAQDSEDWLQENWHPQ